MIIDPAITGLESQRLIELGFAVALVASLWQRYWGFAAFLALALAESHANLRYPFHVWVRDELLSGSRLEADKHAMQATMMYVAAMLGVATLVVLTPMLRRASAGRRLMVVGAAIVTAVLALELISPHKLDAVIFHLEGPFTRAAIAYFVGAAAIAGGALLARRRTEPRAIVATQPGVGGDA